MPVPLSRSATLIVPTLGRLPVRVTEASDDRLDLVLLRRPSTSVLLLEYDATIVVAREDGPQELHGVVRRVAGDRLSFDIEAERAGGQRRTDVRVECDVPVSASAADGSLESVRTRARDLSLGGALLEGLGAMSHGATLSLLVELPDGRPPLPVPARIVRELAGDLRGVAFDAVPDGAQRRLSRFLLLSQWRQARLGAASPGARPAFSSRAP